MKQLTVPISEFDLSTFIKDILKFNKTVVSKEVDPSYAIVVVSEIGGIPNYGPESGGRDIYSELVDEGKRLFLPFSSSNIGEPMPCADGNSYEIDEDSDFCMGDIDCVGYLVEKEGDNLLIQSAINAGGGCPVPPPSVELLEDCDVFEDGMREFLERYINKN